MPIALLIQAASMIPSLAKFLGAPATAQKVADEVGAIATTIAGGTPEEALKKIVANQELTQQFQLQINDQMMKWDAMYLADVANARDRDVKLAQSGFRNNRANALTAFAAAMIVAMLVISIWVSPLNEYVKGVLTFLIGRYSGYLDQIYSFEFGTTKNSTAKDQTIATLSKGDKQ